MKKTGWKKWGACFVAALLALTMTAGAFPAMAAPENSHEDGDKVYDLTDFYTGEAATHDCELYLKKMCDDDGHWNQCSVCGQKYDAMPHSFTSMGDDTCVWWNQGQTRYCAECGYQTIYKRSHIDDTSKWITRPDQKYHYYRCQHCNSYGNISEDCIDSNGNPITCEGGTCAVCGYTYGKSHTYFNSTGGESGTVKCSKCGVEMLRFDGNTGSWVGDNVFQASVRITWWNPDIFGNDAAALAKTVGMSGTGGGVNAVVSNLSAKAENGCIYASCTLTFPYEEREANRANDVWSVQPYSTRITSAVHGGRIENAAPVIQKASVSYGTAANGYTTKAKLEVVCSDNWVYDANYVQVRLLNPDHEPLTEWLTCGRTGELFAQTIDIVSEVQGEQTYYVQARDAGGNQSEKAVAISNLDSKAPEVISGLVTSEEWSQTKTLTIVAKDEGAGEVSIAFNDVSDYQPAKIEGDTFTRSFTFTGEVYGSVKAAVYLKDAVGNVTTEFIQIYNLDNTSPTIEAADLVDAFDENHEAYAWSLVVKANDLNPKLSISGSEIVGYALTKGGKTPESEEFKNESELLIVRSGTYTLWVMDQAGNLSKCQEPIVVHSDLTFQGKEINAVQYNGVDLSHLRYNGKRIRL